MFKELKMVEKRELEGILQIFSQIDFVRAQQDTIYKQYSMPKIKFNFIERYITRRKEYIQEQERYNRAQRHCENEISRLEKEIEKLENELRENTFIKKVWMFPPKQSSVIERIDQIEQAKTFQELGYSSEEDVKKCLEANGVPIRFDSLEEGFQMFPKTSARNAEFMKKAVEVDVSNIRYDKSNNAEVYIVYLKRKIEELKAQQKVDYSEDISNQIKKFTKYISELTNPREVEDGKYKVPHTFIFEELRFSETPKDSRVYRGNADIEKYKYLEVDGKFPIEYGKKLEELYLRQDIIFGVHGTVNTDVGEYLKNGLRESRNNDAPSGLANNTVLYGDYLLFTNVLDYGDSWGSQTVFLLGFPKDAFSKGKNEYIWGSDELESKKYILPQYIMGFYRKDGNTREVVANNGKNQHQYRYLFKDASVYQLHARPASEFIDTQEAQLDRDV